MFLTVTKEHYENFVLPITKKEIDNPSIIKEKTFFPDPELKRGSDGAIEGVIPIRGTLGAWYGTLYEDINTGIERLENDPKVKRIIFDINSPGGYVDGVIETAQKIKNSKKETIAKVGYMAASGAYWIASQCDKIVATTKIAMFGSIGVIVSFYDWKEYLEKAGIKEVVITSTDAPKKYVDPASKEGAKEILARLDKIHNEFATAVATGRNTSLESVNNDFGKGGVLFAEEAKKVGMIDEITNILEGNQMEKTEKVYSQEELNEKIEAAEKAAARAAKAEFLKHAEFFGRANNETILENIKQDKPFVDCVKDYYEEEYANKVVAEKHEENPPESHSSEDDGDTDGEEAKKKAYNEKVKEEAKRTLGIDV